MSRQYCHGCKNFKSADGKCQCESDQPIFRGTPEDEFARITADMNARWPIDDGDVMESGDGVS